MNRLTAEGHLICRPAFGYVRDPLTRMLSPEPQQQEVIEQMHIWYLCGVSMNEIGTRLNKEGKMNLINLNKKTPLKNPRFHTSTISLILHNYHFIMDDKTPPFSYPQRVRNWNDHLLLKAGNNAAISDIPPILSEMNE